MIRKTEGYFWAIIGSSICLLAWKTQLGAFREPGPGFVAFLSGLFIVAIGLVMILKGALAQSSPGGFPRITLSPHARTRLLYTIALLFGFALLLETLGYPVTAFGMMWGFFFFFGGKRWVPSILISLFSVLATYLVFEIWLRCPFPRGIFF